MRAKQGCYNSTSSTTPIKVYRNAPFLTVKAAIYFLKKKAQFINVFFPTTNILLCSKIYMFVHTAFGLFLTYFGFVKNSRVAQGSLLDNQPSSICSKVQSIFFFNSYERTFLVQKSSTGLLQ